ncbi:5'-nucleotidase SurE [Striga asiatica]|uniref:5'-nucleotidase SurE n=1 Tax=Striga asiatica TaxID=4170 RepID=A0A5A7RD89_STRAF|nr:5'-nucleotidase SurE [Striga asiatica]
MYDCLPTVNRSLQFSLQTHKFRYITCSKLGKPAKRSVPESSLERASFSINSVPNRLAIAFPWDEREYEESPASGLMEKGCVRDIRLSRDQNGESALEMARPPVESGIREETEGLSDGEVFNFRVQKKANKLSEIDSSAEKEMERGGHGGRGELSTSSRRQMMGRSNVMAKQVISIRSALSLGFVSQLWVHTSSAFRKELQKLLHDSFGNGEVQFGSAILITQFLCYFKWVVMAVEVKPNLLSGAFERFLFKEIRHVGDVIFVEEENVIEVDIKSVGLETLVGYSVVTTNGQRIGKVRGYSFSINSGRVESLELDSFGISIIPSSLVSTYAVFVEDVVKVSSDTVFVHETAALSRVHRLTKGIWNGQNAGISNNKFDQHVNYYTEKQRKKSTSKRRGSKIRRNPDNWELPMDYL